MRISDLNALISITAYFLLSCAEPPSLERVSCSGATCENFSQDSEPGADPVSGDVPFASDQQGPIMPDSDPDQGPVPASPVPMVPLPLSHPLSQAHQAENERNTVKLTPAMVKDFAAIKNEITSIKGPATSNANNAYSYGYSGETIEALGEAYEVSRDKEILDKMISFSDVMLASRNDKTAKIKMWTGKVEPCWPNNADPCASSSGDVVGHILFTSKLIFQSKSLYKLKAGGNQVFGRTYEDRARTYLTESLKTIDNFFIPNFVNANGRLYFPKSTAFKDSGKGIPWNQQGMFLLAFQRASEILELLNESPEKSKAYDKLVKASIRWFEDNSETFNCQSKLCLNWSYSSNEPSQIIHTEDTTHAKMDYRYIFRIYLNPKYKIKSDMMARMTNTLRYAIWKGENSYSGLIDGTDGDIGHAGHRTSISGNFIFYSIFDDKVPEIVYGKNGSPSGWTQKVKSNWIKYYKMGGFIDLVKP